MAEPTTVLVAGVISACAVVVAALVAPNLAGRLAHRNKVAEFRQAWINAFRDDMADFLTASDHLHRADTSPAAQMGDAASLAAQNAERQRIKGDLLLAYYRMHLRINPEPNKNEDEDQAFLQALHSLVSPDGSAPASEWRVNRQNAVAQGRRLLKREWERVKGGDDARTLDLDVLLKEYEAALASSSLGKSAKVDALHHARNFVKWSKGEFRPEVGPSS